MSKRFFITGGGTGGHIYPAIAVADELEKNPDYQVFYVGNPHNLEYSVTQSKTYKFLPIKVSGMPRKLSLKFLSWGFELCLAVIKSMYYLNKYKPDAIFGTGGYVSAPVLIAANILKKFPYMLHDCDIQPGVVTRKLAPNAKCVSLAFESAKTLINNENCFINGNPVRPEFKTMDKTSAKQSFNFDLDRPVLCVMGGSQGAATINNAFVEIIKELSLTHNFQIIFQTGKKNFAQMTDRLNKIYKDFHTDKNLVIKPYFDDMITVIKASDIIISRAGSLSLSEIYASETAPILIPYPFAAANHQRKNAKYVEEKSACIYLEDDETNPNSLLEIILDISNNKDKMNFLKENSSKLAKPDALDNIIKQLEGINE